VPLESLLGLIDGGAGKLAHVLPVDEEILHLPGSQIRDAEVKIVLAELAKPSGIRPRWSWVLVPQAGQTQVVLIPIF
jgi:hypothetical protein